MTSRLVDGEGNSEWSSKGDAQFKLEFREEATRLPETKGIICKFVEQVPRGPQYKRETMF